MKVFDFIGIAMPKNWNVLDARLEIRKTFQYAWPLVGQKVAVFACRLGIFKPHKMTKFRRMILMQIPDIVVLIDNNEYHATK